MRKIAFAPLVSSSSSVLFLGTMPSEESLRKQQYYGHKSNQFWKILFSLYNKPFTDDYQERKVFILQNNLALWDVLHSCEGQGSLDSNIKNETANDFSRFYKEYSRIKYICFTSKKAEEFYKRYVGFDDDHIFITLPSPSTANARMTLDEKKTMWYDFLESILSLS